DHYDESHFMKTILAFIPKSNDIKNSVFEDLLTNFRPYTDYKIIEGEDPKKVLPYLEINPRLCCILYDFEEGGLETYEQIQAIHYELPVFAFADNHAELEVNLKTLKSNLHFLNYRTDQSEASIERILSSIKEYFSDITPPFTNALMHYSTQNNYSYCTPGHADGSAFLKSPLGTLFYDFFGPNIFKADLSVSMDDLGSLLDHSGKFKEAEEYIAKQYGSDYCYIVTNGSSTANKIIAMHNMSEGDTVLIDRNSHKSITHVLMMMNVYPIYLLPSRNLYGIIGGISQEQFTTKNIEKKLSLLSKKINKPLSFPNYAVITNSTYDGVLYDTNFINKTLDINNVHFDAAWIPYAPFSEIYQGHFGLSGDYPNKIIYENYSSHKLLAAFSQSATIQVKGAKFNRNTFSDSYMMHASTSPFYPIVASTETSAAMMNGQYGKRIMEDTLKESFSFRQEIQRLREENEAQADGWFYNILQPDTLDGKINCFSMKENENWHGYNGDVSHLSLDPIKITLLMPGLYEGSYDEFGIPACLLAKYLEYKSIVVEKTGPYSLLFLFGIGSDRSKSLKLLNELTGFKTAFDANQKIEKILPNVYQEAPRFYKKLTIQDLAEKIHRIYIEHDLCNKMYSAYGSLPSMEMTPYQARQKIVNGNVYKVPLADIKNHVLSEMILPYPPGIPLVLPGEKITNESESILDFLITLCKIGDEFPGFETSIHGINFDENNQPFALCIGDP
ncbi:MAG: hypothetical protein KDH94_02155, partial [Coxiellaceae bacterium]|nr:hypothetical protein [Coxiellaceae bacterium]